VVGMMKKGQSMGVVLVLLGAGVVTSGAQHPGTDRERLAGAWRLVALEQPGADGLLHSVDCKGMFVFTRDGHLAVQVMDREVKPQGPAASPEPYAQGGYEASYGSYTLDSAKHTFTFHVEGALVRTLVGKDLVRRYQLAGKRLVITSARPDEHWRVVWERE